MAITGQNVIAEVNASSQDLDKAAALVVTAKLLLDHYLIDALEPPPAEVYDRAHLATAVEMFNQDKAPNGVLNQAYDVGDGTLASAPIRIGADPLRPAYPLLASWMPVGVIG